VEPDEPFGTVEHLQKRQKQLGDAFYALPCQAVPQSLCLAGQVARKHGMTLEKAIRFLRMGYFDGS